MNPRAQADPTELEKFLQSLWKAHTEPSLVRAPSASVKILATSSKAEMEEANRRSMKFDQHRELPQQFPVGASWRRTVLHPAGNSLLLPLVTCPERQAGHTMCQIVCSGRGSSSETSGS